MKQNKIISALLAVLLLLAAIPALPAAAAFPDSMSPEVRNAAETLAALGIVSGYEDGHFHADRTLTRAQFAKMGVVCLGEEDKALLNQNYTIFPDVRSGHWATGYVNTAVKDCAILNGYPNGTFSPENAITEAEAVTICLRMLGYTEATIGVFWPADYISKANEIGLTNGLTISANTPMTRGRSAILLSNLLVTETVGEDGKKADIFALSMGQTATDKVILLATPETDLSLAQGVVNVSVDGGAASQRAVTNAISSSLVGWQGVLLSGRDGKITGFVPYQYNITTLVVQERDENGITTSEGGKILIPLGTVVVDQDKVVTYERAWTDFKRGLTVNFFYDKNGVLAYITTGSLGTSSTTGGAAHVLKDDYKASKNPLLDFYSAEMVAKASIYKHGRAIDATQLRKNDVVIYRESLARFDICTDRISGAIQRAYPTAARTQSVQLYSETFSMQPGYAPDLSAYEARDVVTLLLTSDGTVAAVLPEREAAANMCGLVLSSSNNTAKIALTTGHTIQAELSRDYDDVVSTFVEISVGSYGTLSLLRPSYSAVANKDLNLASWTLGTLQVAGNLSLYECADRRADVVEIELEDLGSLDKVVPGASVLYYHTNRSGLVDAVVLENVTGNALIYGRITQTKEEQWVNTVFLGYEKAEDGITDKLDEDGNRIPIYGKEGEDIRNAFSVTFDSTPLTDTATLTSITGEEGITLGVRGPYGGMAVRDDIIRAFAPLSKLGEVRLEAFNGSSAVDVGGYLLTISDSVQVYNESTGKFITLTEAKTKFSNFHIYSEKTAETGGIVRLIAVK